MKKTGTEAQEIVDKLKSTFSRKEYTFDDLDKGINIASVRNRASGIAGSFDDKLYVTRKEGGVWEVEEYPVTTEPSPNYLQSPAPAVYEKGAAILQPGQWYSYEIGLHKSTYTAVVQSAGAVTVWRDNNYDYNADYENSIGTPETGYFGINIHKHRFDNATADYKDENGKLTRTSAGCTIFKYTSDFESFMSIVKTYRQNTGKKKFSYTLINKVDFEDSPPVLPVTLYPPPSERNTHILLSMTSVYDQPKLEAFHIKTLEINTEVVILKNHIGTDATWAWVTDNIDVFYIERKYIKSIEEKSEEEFVTERSPSKQLKQINSDIAEIDWLSQKTNIPYYDPHDGRHKVVVETKYQDHSVTVEEILADAFEEGATILLKENNKKLDILEEIMTPTGSDRAIQSVDLEYPDRGNIRVLVESPDRNMQAFEDEEPTPEYYYESEYTTEDFREILAKLTGKISSFSEQIKNFKGKVSVFDTKREVDNLNQCPDEIEKLFRENRNSSTGIFSEKGFLKIGWTIDMKPVFLEFTSADQSETIETTKGLESFQRKASISSKRTQNFIFNMQDIVRFALEYPWIQFLDNYADYKEVKIIDEAGDKKEKGQKEGPPVKTLGELEKENNLYNSSKNRISVKEERKTQSDFVGSSYLDTKKFPKLAKELSKTEEGLYTAFLNNVDVQGLMLGAAKCLLASQPIVGSIQNLKNDWDVLKSEYDKYSNTTLEKELEYFYPDDFPIDDISAAFVKSLTDSISSMVSAALNSLLLNLINSITNLCQDSSENVNLSNNKDNLPLPDFSGLKDRIQELFERGNVNLDDLRNLFEDLSILLSPNELCSLLEGEPSDNTLGIVISLLSRKYCHLGLKTEAEVIDFFVSLALEIDFKGCRDIVTQAIPEALDDYICSVDNKLREDLLRGKGLTPEEINNQLAKERERSKKLVESFLKELKKGILSGKAQIPNMFCQKDKEGNIKEGPMPFMDDSLKLTIGTMVQSLVDPIYSSFSKEGRDFVQNFFQNVPEDAQFTDPLTDSTVNFSMPVRKPLPQVKNFYSEEIIVEGNDSSFSLSLPIEFAENDIEGLLFQEGILNSDIQAELKDKCSKSATVTAQMSRQPRELTDKVEYVELSACDILGLETPLPPPQEEVLGENNLNLRTEKEPDCPEGEPEQTPALNGFLQPSPISEIQSRDIQIEGQTQESTIPGSGFGLGNNIREDVLSEALEKASQNLRREEGLSLPVNPCDVAPEVGYLVKVGSRETIEKKVIPPELVDFVLNNGYGANYRSHSFLKATMESAFSNTEVVDFSVERFVEQTGLHQSIREDVLNNFYLFLNNSPYLNKIERLVHSNKYTLDYVTLGPEPREACDPHLLRVKQVADKTLEDIENNFCLDLESDSASSGPRKTNVDSSLIRMSVSLTLRHYIIETLSTGILSLSTLQSATDISEIKKKYILERIKFQMDSYDEEYYVDFIREAVEEYSGDKSNKTKEQILIQMISEEYKEIMNGMFNTMLLGNKEESISEKYFQNSIPTFDRVSISQHGGVNALIASKSKFIFLKDGQSMTLCFSLPTSEYHESGTSQQIELLSLPSEQESETQDNSEINIFSQEELMDYEFGEQENTQEVELQIQIVEQENQRRRAANAEIGTTELLKNQSVLSADLFFKAIISPTLGDGKYLIPISTISLNPIESPEEQKKQFLKETPVRALFEMAYPLDKYESVISIHEIELSSKQANIKNAFAETRDELYTLFYSTLPQTEDWKKTPKTLETFGGSVGLTSIQDFNFGFKDTPCGDFSFNFGLDVCWGNPFKGLGGMSFALKAAVDTSLSLLKHYIEENDPIIKLAKKLSFLSKLACVNIDTSTFSGLLALNSTMLPTPLTMLYNALGFGLYESSSSLSSDSEEGERARRDVEGAGLTLPEYCGAPTQRLVLPEDTTDEQLQSEELSLREAVGPLVVMLGSLQEQKNNILRSNISYDPTEASQAFARVILAYYTQLGGIPDDKLPLAVANMTDFARGIYDEVISQIEDLLREIESITPKLEAVRAMMLERELEPLLSEFQQRELRRQAESERLRTALGEQDVSSEEYYESILQLTSRQVYEKTAELEILISQLAVRRNTILGEVSNYDTVGRRLFPDGVRNPENLLPDPQFRHDNLVRVIEQNRMRLNMLRRRAQELAPL